MNSRFGFDFLTFTFKDNQANNEDSNDADGVVHSSTHKRKRIYGEWQKLLVAAEPIRAKMIKKKTLNPVHPFLTKIVTGPGLILSMIQQMILLVNLSFEVCISIFNKKIYFTH